MTGEAALSILRERSGSMYDPRVVEMFEAIYRDIVVVEDETPEQIDVMRRITEARADRKPQVEPPIALAASQGAVASSDVLAFVSLARLASGDGGVADVLALSSNLIADIVPGVTGGWYLPDAGRTKLAVFDSFGPSAAVVRGMQVGVGQRLTGWVAASRQPVVNSDAALDLESVAEQSGLRACTSVPLLTGDTLTGVLTLYSPSAELFDENRGRLLQMIAPHIAGAIQAALRKAASVPEKATGTTGRDLRLVSTRS
jgi:GAF domain-containing protein